MIHKMMIDETHLAIREMYMMMHPELEPDCELIAGDVIELVEGYFILNEDLNPMQIATVEQIQKARQSP